jgi:tRNA threonylcarbamoyladenosine biosynthesis protein TsaB
VAILRSDGRPTRLIEFQSTRRLGAELAPAIQRLLAEEKLGADSPPDLVTVDTGPGSYTGLRIGLAAAKGLAFAWGRPLIGVPTVDAIAAQAPRDARRVLCVLDASRGQIYTVLFTGGAPNEATLIDAEALSAALSTEPTYCIGDAASQFDGVPGVRIAEPELAWPNALRIAEAGRRVHLAGARHDAMRLAPIYYRPSEAEEQRRKRKMRTT